MSDEEEFDEILRNTGKRPNLMVMSADAARAMGMDEDVIAECQDENGVVWFDARKYRRKA